MMLGEDEWIVQMTLVPPHMIPLVHYKNYNTKSKTVSTNILQISSDYFT